MEDISWSSIPVEPLNGRDIWDLVEESDANEGGSSEEEEAAREHIVRYIPRDFPTSARRLDAFLQNYGVSRKSLPKEVVPLEEIEMERWEAGGYAHRLVDIYYRHEAERSEKENEAFAEYIDYGDRYFVLIEGGYQNQSDEE